jgi:DNA-binding transcriptional regulator YiaG
MDSAKKSATADSWNKESIRFLRRRLGWSQSDLARRLQCSSLVVEELENGAQTPTEDICQLLYMISHQAEECSGQVQNTPRAEKILDEDSLGQIHSDNLPS